MSEYEFTTPPPFSKNVSQAHELPLASIQHRLGGYALDLALLLTSAITLFIGWIIWNLVLWGQGQTPSKQILKMRVYSLDTKKPASWGHMAIRQFLIPLAFSFVYLLIAVLAMALAVDSPTSSQIGLFGIGYLAYFALILTDAFWIFKGTDRQRLTDKWARTYIVNEA